uniref:Uncharacterized protein n=1 Tax=Avena sativa TaxID=4498 RepID=A0ACD5XD79_AVESA
MALIHSTNQALLDGQLNLLDNTFGYIKSMALKAALDLRIADAFDHHGGAATLTQIADRVTLHRSKISSLRRLMRVLIVSGVFGVQSAEGSSELLYVLTPTSSLLVGPRNLVSITTMSLSPYFVASYLELGTWFHQELPDPCIFKLAHGEPLWKLAEHDASFDALINDGMVSDTSFIMDIAIKESGGVFQGITSLIDVAGGLGAATQAISKEFPHVEYTVLDLDHVIAKAPTGTNVKYIAGDMFESIPRANAVFLKWILHDWGHDDCVKILRNCKKAIPPRDAGGKVIILDIVFGAGQSNVKHTEVQASFDVYMMIINGIERDELEWKMMFSEAGFTDYKIIPVLGFRSIIEVYP